ncbi:MAG: FMN-binding negative transcriptional regulator [Propionibacteriaceae bacterium]|jgi:transcriptional regulator|nr:FMN-binding negative transcriptional regulator [Propionibacteriaceae bacterium]
MYTPKHYKMSDEAVMELLNRPQSGDLVTQGPNGIVSTYTPFIYEPKEGELGSLLGHLAWVNDAWKHTGKEVLVILHGPEAYISSDWIREPHEDQVVAITNFVSVHVYGELIVHTDHDWALDAVARLSSAFEPSYDLLEVPSELLEGMLKAMVAFEVKITRIEGHARMSQNRSPERLEKIIAGLRSVGGVEAASWMERYSLPQARAKEALVQAAAARRKPIAEHE